MPELKNVSGKRIHEPWLMSRSEMQQFGVTIGQDYPAPTPASQLVRPHGGTTHVLGWAVLCCAVLGCAVLCYARLEVTGLCWARLGCALFLGACIMLCCTALFLAAVLCCAMLFLTAML